jgi:YspA, cpYpsA-related SLOG family/Possible lysine decarboxylase
MIEGKLMRLIIAGGREYQFTEQDKACLDSLDFQQEQTRDPIVMVLSGGSGHQEWLNGRLVLSGADRWGARWAESRGIPVSVFKPDWSLGRKAGPLRNEKMASMADAVVLFPGGRGTDSMYREALKARLIIHDWRGGGEPKE